MLRTVLARALDDGRFRGRATELVAHATARIAAPRIARPARIPEGMRSVAVGGATLGGSGKSRVAVAIAARLAEKGARVVLVGHAYRARPGRARVVGPSDPISLVGDEALVCAEVLAGKARVVVGPSRQAAIDLAAALRPRPDVLVLDGPLQLAPDRATLSVLAVDALEPWGTGAVFPAGNLRARPADLLAHADVVVRVDPLPRDVDRLRGRTIGLFTAIARPRRLVSALARAGIAPAVTVEAPDHGPAPAAELATLMGAPVDAWAATPKCALHLRGMALSAPLVVLDASVDVPERCLHGLP